MSDSKFRMSGLLDRIEEGFKGGAYSKHDIQMLDKMSDALDESLNYIGDALNAPRADDLIGKANVKKLATVEKSVTSVLKEIMAELEKARKAK